MPAFFVPFKEPHEADAAFDSLAKSAGFEATLPRAKRIHLLRFAHNGEMWTAEVGKRLHGRRQGEILIAGKPVRRECETSDAAVVLAIFPGSPYVVITDGGRAECRLSRWSHQFTVGRPVQIVRFDGHILDVRSQSAAQDCTLAP